WELEDEAPADWDEGARPYLEAFLTLHTPHAAALPPDGKRTLKELVRSPLNKLFRPALSEEEVTRALTRWGEVDWAEADFRELLGWLGCGGFGRPSPQGVQRALEGMARAWEGPPPAVSIS